METEREIKPHSGSTVGTICAELPNVLPNCLHSGQNCDNKSASDVAERWSQQVLARRWTNIIQRHT